MDIMMNGYIKGTLVETKAETKAEEGAIQLLPTSNPTGRLATIKVSNSGAESPISIGDEVTCLRLGLIKDEGDTVYLKDTDVISYTIGG